MRYAWQRENSDNYVIAKQSFTSRLIYIAYNTVYLIVMVLPFTKTIDYRAGFIAFFIVIITRAAANLYRNNVLTLEQVESFPLRSP